MKRAGMATLILSAMAVTGCAENRDPDEIKSEVEVTGCLTASSDEFVLTELERASAGTTIGGPSTETYRLLGDAEALRPHVGSQVRIAGMAEAPDVAIVREVSPAVPATPPGVGTTGAADGAPQPKVSTEAQTRLEVSALRVRTVTPTGTRCAPQP